MVKQTKNSIIKIITLFFGYGILADLLIGGLSFFGYLAALIIGGDTAAKICAFIYTDVYPVLVVISTVLIVFGVIKLYLCGETRLTKQR